ncbi:MAG: hypothetical protein OXH76_16630, partial [Boseongicola sp.]|nr:hypothetical protein [Boseongicola sp.]
CVRRWPEPQAGNPPPAARRPLEWPGPPFTLAAFVVIDVGAASEHQELILHGSHDPAREADQPLHRWATTVVAVADTHPGVSVSIVPRQRWRSPPVCPTCQGAAAERPA